MWESFQNTLLNANDIYLFLMIFPYSSLHCMLVPVQYQEYDSRDRGAGGTGEASAPQ